MFDAAGGLVAEVRGFVVKRATRAAVERAEQERVADWLYEVEWRSQPSRSQAADFIPAPSALASRADARVEPLSAEHGLAAYRELLPPIEDLSLAYAGEALRRLGFTPTPGEHVSPASLAESLGVSPPTAGSSRACSRC